MRGMRNLRSLAVGVMFSCAVGCGEEAPRIEPTPEIEQAPGSLPDAPATPRTPRPWTVRLVRACSEWAGADAFATSRHVFGCDGAIFDRATGALIDARPGRSAPEAAVGDVTVWASGADDAPTFVVRDAELHASAPIALPERVSVEHAQDGQPLLLGGVRRLYELDLSARAVRPVEGGEACADALAIGRARSGAVQCIVHCGDGDHAACLRTVGVEREVALGALYGASALGAGRFFARNTDETARVIGDDGATIATHEAAGGVEIRDVSADAILVAREETTELWRVDGDPIEVERVVGRRADQAAFAGDEIVLVAGRSLFWLHRGEPRELPELPPPSAPRGLIALHASVDGEFPSFEGDGEVIGRRVDDVAAFVAQGDRWAQVVVARSDAGELARFTDDAAWARAAAARYVDPGSQRWAKTWRSAEGRVMRGHTYIGGCERSHIDVELRERAGVLERWRVVTGEGEGIDAILGPTPSDARTVEGVRGDSYEGDPSTGRW